MNCDKHGRTVGDCSYCVTEQWMEKEKQLARYTAKQLQLQNEIVAKDAEIENLLEILQSRDHDRNEMDELKANLKAAELSHEIVLKERDEARADAEKHKARTDHIKKVCIHYSSTISKIDYILGRRPNEMELSDYDVHADENEVVKRAENIVKALNNAQKVIIDMEDRIMRLEESVLAKAHLSLDRPIQAMRKKK